ncbi:MAG: 50S ribosomal protein L2 [Methanomassiliicoccales archaeon PtaU1.Bin124]|nr:MAG: 50S ribosomal protein L2 [Methanomassiliicoccales archaeon PtaU1.Bin124]
MGKNLRQQRRGRGGMNYASPSHRHVGEIKLPLATLKSGKIVDIMHAPGRLCPVAKVDFGGESIIMLAAEGIMVGQNVSVDGAGEIKAGNVLPLSAIPEGTLVFNMEARPGDGGKYVKVAGSSATLVTKGERVTIQMPSGVLKTFDPRCRAVVGIVAGGGHDEKPFGKAGNKFHAYRSRSKAYFKVKGIAMNPVDHPHGGGGHPHVGKPSTVSRNAPPGRKVGRLSPQKKKKGKR